MAEGNGASVYIYAIAIQTQALLHRQILAGETR
jgi:hypothetical protein